MSTKPQDTVTDSQHLGDQDGNQPAARNSILAKIYWLTKRSIQLILGFIAFYLVIAAIGLIPVNGSFQPAPEGHGVVIAISSNAFHSDIIMPLRHETFDWQPHFPKDNFSGQIAHCTHIAMGWGDRDFYVDTPRWSDMTVGKSLNALAIPSRTVMRVSLTKLSYYPKSSYRTVRISNEQYKRLCTFALNSFQTNDDQTKNILAGKSYGGTDAFFHANGSYHAFNTCNCWVGRALKASGIKVGWFTPLPKSVFLYL